MEPAALTVTVSTAPQKVVAFQGKQWLLESYTGSTGAYEARYSEYFPERPSDADYSISGTADIVTMLNGLAIFDGVQDNAAKSFVDPATNQPRTYQIKRGDLVLYSIAKILLAEGLYFHLSHDATTGSNYLYIENLGSPEVTGASCDPLASQADINVITELVCLPTGEASEFIQPHVASDSTLISKYGRRIGWVYIDLGPCVRNWDCDPTVWFPSVCDDEFYKRASETLAFEQSSYFCYGTTAPVVWPGHGVWIDATTKVWAPRVVIDETGTRLEVRSAVPVRRSMNVWHGISSVVIAGKTAVVDTIQASEGDNADPTYPLDMYIYVPAGYTPRKLNVLYSVEPFRMYLPPYDPSTGSFPFKSLMLRDAQGTYDATNVELVITKDIPTDWPTGDLYGRVIVGISVGMPTMYLDVIRLDPATATEDLLATITVGDGTDPGNKVVEFITSQLDPAAPSYDFRGYQLKLVFRPSDGLVYEKYMRVDVVMPAELHPAPISGVHEPGDYSPTTVSSIEVGYWTGTAPDFSTTPAWSAVTYPSADRGVATIDLSTTTFQTPGWFRVRVVPAAKCYVKATASLTSIAVPS